MTQIAMCVAQGPRENIEDAACGLVLHSMTDTALDAVLLVVADGAGGREGGEVAAKTAIATIPAFVSHALVTACNASRTALDSDTITAILRKAIVHAHRAVLRRSAEEPALCGMASTMVCALVLRGVLHVAWVGDSRAYRYHKGSLQRCTRDHSQVQQLIDAGLLDPRVADHHPLAHHITRCLGQPGELDVEVGLHPISSGDKVLLVTDGLTDVLSDATICEALQRCDTGQLSVAQLPAQLTSAAIAAGTGDNATALVCDYQPEPGDDLALRETVTEAYELEFLKVLNPCTGERP